MKRCLGYNRSRNSNRCSRMSYETYCYHHKNQSNKCSLCHNDVDVHVKDLFKELRNDRINLNATVTGLLLKNQTLHKQINDLQDKLGKSQNVQV